MKISSNKFKRFNWERKLKNLISMNCKSEIKGESNLEKYSNKPDKWKAEGMKEKKVK